MPQTDEKRLNKLVNLCTQGRQWWHRDSRAIFYKIAEKLNKNGVSYRDIEEILDMAYVAMAKEFSVAMGDKDFENSL